MSATSLYYVVKPLIPRYVQILMRRWWVRRVRKTCSEIWPIDPGSGSEPPGWPGWPEGKDFALILTHDVDTAKGQERCLDLMNLEMEAGFRSSFNFVPERYDVSPTLRSELSANGFEVGVHGLNHDGKLYSSLETFQSRAERINGYIRQWGASGFRSPSMHHNLEWIHLLDIQYDASTFDTDPFEPQSDGIGTIFPFYLENSDGSGGYVEMPYTLPQDFTLFVLLNQRDINIWLSKLDWLVERGGMVLLNTHPDYMNFGRARKKVDEYPSGFYSAFLEGVKEKYSGRYWHGTAGDLSAYLIEMRRHSASDHAVT